MRRLLAPIAFVLSFTFYFCEMTRTAHAMSDPPPDPPPPQYDPPSGNYTYDIPMTMDQEIADSGPSTPDDDDDDEAYMTFYDVAGYVPGSAQGPTGWTVTSQLTGFTPPGVVVSDNPSLINLTFEYSTGPELAGTVNLGDFTFKSIYGTTALGQYGGEDSNEITRQLETYQGGVPRPVVPEPMSGTILIPAIVAACLRRKRSVSTTD
jgi:hypothetical protein